MVNRSILFIFAFIFGACDRGCDGGRVDIADLIAETPCTPSDPEFAERLCEDETFNYIALCNTILQCPIYFPEEGCRACLARYCIFKSCSAFAPRVDTMRTPSDAAVRSIEENESIQNVEDAGERNEEAASSDAADDQNEQSE